MTQPRTYPPGVPCWIDTEQPDPQAAAGFYSGLFGWQVEAPPGASGQYLLATLDGADVAAVSQAPAGPDPAWHTYVAVESADDAATLVTAAGGSLTEPPQDAGPGGRAGRTASCVDPEGAGFRLWQPRARLGAQLVNAPGCWNFSNLHAHNPGAALAFYTAVFAWEPLGAGDGTGTMLRTPGYGDHLAATCDPEIYQRQAMAPPGFADVVAGLEPAEPGETPHWHVMFTVADRDASAADVERLGGTVLASSQSQWTRTARVRDPQGAQFTLSQFTPPDDWPDP